MSGASVFLRARRKVRELPRFTASSVLVTGTASRYISSVMSRRTNKSKTVAQKFANSVFDAIQSLGATSGRIVAAVSGGPDSVALLVGLHSLRRSKKLELGAAHVNHALRGEESDSDEQFVRKLCERLRIPLAVARLPLPTHSDDREEGIEATARNLRYEFLVNVAHEMEAKSVATAHTADDQAETVLHRIVRGTGIAGLAGIPVSRELAHGIKLVRPLLSLRRADVLEFLAAVGQEFRQDRSNLDLSFTRNRLRHELIPYLAQHFNSRVTEAIARLASQAAAAQAAIDHQVQRLARRAIVKQDHQHVVLGVSPLRRTEPYLVRELLRRIWAEQSWPLQEVGQSDLENVAELITGIGGAHDLPGGVHARLSRNHLVLTQTRGAD